LSRFWFFFFIWNGGKFMNCAWTWTIFYISVFQAIIPGIPVQFSSLHVTFKDRNKNGIRRLRDQSGKLEGFRIFLFSSEFFDKIPTFRKTCNYWNVNNIFYSPIFSKSFSFRIWPWCFSWKNFWTREVPREVCMILVVSLEPKDSVNR